jgi:hypothetical protein
MIAVSTALQDPPTGMARRKMDKLNPTLELPMDGKKRERLQEFAHSFPIHTHPSASILSKENNESLSFRGFGNLACMSSSAGLTFSTSHGFRQLATYRGELCQGSASRGRQLTVVRLPTASSPINCSAIRFPHKSRLSDIDSRPPIHFPVD